MSEIKNSKLLDDIIRYAVTFDGRKDAALTAERFLYAVITTVFGRSPVEIGKEDRERITDMLKESFRLDKGFIDIKRTLKDFIDINDTATEQDKAYIEFCFDEARTIAAAKKYETLGVDTVLRVILKIPDEFIGMCITNALTQSSPSQSSSGISISEEIKKKMARQLGLIPDTDEDSGLDDFDDDYVPEEPEPDSKTKIAELTERVRCINEQLLDAVYGQDNAVSVFTSGYFQSELLSMIDKKRKRPGATFLFAGPPGVGKTFLAETAASVLGLPFQRFDMSEYSDKEANLEFCGSDKVYKNGKEGNVTSFVDANPRCVLLFDEIEKAHINVIHLFLQILDAGRIRDNFTDKEVSFKDAIIIFTTNAGKQLYEDAETTDFSGVTRKVILKALQNDVKPETNTPFFPAAICSRFASGNVVMFNYITAHNLRNIAKREILRHADNFSSEVKINFDIDEQVYSALLFAEGGSADARTITSRAGTFFDKELYELFRLFKSDKVKTTIKDLNTVHINVDLPQGDKQIRELFEREDSFEVLVCGPKKLCTLCKKMSPDTSFITVQNTDEAKKILHDRDISFVLLDITYKMRGEDVYMNIEDVESEARDLFWFVRENHPDMPIYLIQTPDRTLNPEEKLSFIRQGVRNVLTLSDGGDGFADSIKEINSELHRQKSMQTLARANKLVTFETSQRLSVDGSTAEITLFDFEMQSAIDAEDSKSIVSSISKPDVSFDQVIGAEDAKKELRYFVEYLKNPKKYMGTGVSTPKGVLLYGPPGTGKTMLAKAMASESDVTFITAEGNQFVEKYQGEGRDKVKQLFRTARKYAPSILFIDEIDAIAKERRGGEGAGGAEVTLTAFLTEMDGFKNNTTKPVFVLAATNFDVVPGTPKSLDQALLRRFDRRLYVDLPNKEERIRYIHLKMKEKTALALSEEKIENIALRSTGMSLADIESVIELSLRSAVRDGNLKVTDEIFEESFETFNGGEEKKWDKSLLERVARHESGHAFLYWQSGETPSYVTIVARGNHGGYMQHSGEGKPIYTKDELLAAIRTSLGGRAAEIVYYGDNEGISSGAASDLAHATAIAKEMVCSYGMDDSLGLATADEYERQNGDLSLQIRKSVNAILEREMKNAVTLIEKNKASIDALVEKLLIENHLSGDAISTVFEEVKKLS